MSEFSQFKSTPSSSPIDVKDAVARQQLRSTQTVSGNPITLTDCAPINAESLVVELEPIQDLHGQSAPYVGGAGKNKLPMTVEGLKAANTNGTWTGNAYAINGGTITILTDNDGNVIGIEANGTFNANSAFLFFDKNTMACPFSIGTEYYIYLEDTINGAQLRVSDNTKYTYGSNTIATLASDFNTADCVAFLWIVSGAQANHFVFYPIVCLATETNTDFAPYSNICPITGYTECEVDDVGKNLLDDNGVVSVYDIDTGGTQRAGYKKTLLAGTYTISAQNGASGAYLDAVLYKDGEFTSIGRVVDTTTLHTFTFTIGTTKELRIFDAASAQTSIAEQRIKAAQFQLEVGSTATTYEPYHSSNATIQFGQTVYGGSVDFLTGVLTVDSGFIASYNGETLPSTWISDRDVYAAGTTPTTGAQVCYKLAEPTTIQLTPQELKLLKQYNYIATNGTTINLGYQPDNVIGEVKGEIEQHLEMPYLRILDNDVDTEIKNYRLYYKFISSAYTLVNLAEMLRHRFIFVEVIYNPSGTANHELLHSALIDPRTIDGFEYGIDAGSGDTICIQSIIAENKFELDVRYTGSHTSGDPTNYYVTIRMVD